MKLLLTLVLTLLFLALESVAVKYVGLGVARIDVTVAIVAFLSLRAGLLEGAAASYAVGSDETGLMNIAMRLPFGSVTS